MNTWAQRLSFTCLVAAALAACTSVVPMSASAPAAVAADGKPMNAPELSVFSTIRAPDVAQPWLKLSTHGLQIFRCEFRDDSLQWVFRQPDADLVDSNGKTVGHHGANYSFEYADTSRLIGIIIAHESAPVSGDLPWLLLSTRSFGEGKLAGVTHVQRINTHGGIPPTICKSSQKGELLRVDFSADFVFYKTR